MKIPYRWIREFVDLTITPEQARELLVNAGVEVAGLIPIAPEIKGVVVGEIEAIEKELGQSHGHRLLLCHRAIGAATIHGVTSEGMLCSERELGLGEEHEAGVLALDADAPLGAD